MSGTFIVMVRSLELFAARCVGSKPRHQTVPERLERLEDRHVQGKCACLRVTRFDAARDLVAPPLRGWPPTPYRRLAAGFGPDFGVSLPRAPGCDRQLEPGDIRFELGLPGPLLL